MATFTIYSGRARPRRAVGSNQCRLAQFAEKNQCWHYAAGQAAVAAIAGLQRRGIVRIDRGDDDSIRCRVRYRYVP